MESVLCLNGEIQKKIEPKKTKQSNHRESASRVPVLITKLFFSLTDHEREEEVFSCLGKMIDGNVEGNFSILNPRAPDPSRLLWGGEISGFFSRFLVHFLDFVFFLRRWVLINVWLSSLKTFVKENYGLF